MSDITDIVSAMGGYQAATPQDKTALEAVLGSRGGRQRSGSGNGLLRSLALSITSATAGQSYSATVSNLYSGTDYLSRATTNRDGLTATGTTLSGIFATVVPDITITEALYAKTAERGTVTVQTAPVTARAFFSDPFFSDPFFRTGA